MDDIKVGKTISYALRHNPAQFGLAPDPEGFVLVSDLIDGLYKSENIEIQLSDIERIIENSTKKRYELKGDMIRATYGHSSVEIKREKVCPPDVLYHGTAHRFIERIQSEGLRPMERQFVHLSEDIQTAQIVGKRRDVDPIILTVDAKRACEEGIGFYVGNDTTWLSDPIPAKYFI